MVAKGAQHFRESLVSQDRESDKNINIHPCISLIFGISGVSGISWIFFILEISWEVLDFCVFWHFCAFLCIPVHFCTFLCLSVEPHDLEWSFKNLGGVLRCLVIFVGISGISLISFDLCNHFQGGDIQQRKGWKQTHHRASPRASAGASATASARASARALDRASAKVQV